MHSYSKDIFRIGRPMALALGALLAANAQAAQSQNRTWSGNTSVDAVTDTTVASLTNTLPSSMEVYNVWVSVTWLKTDGSCTAPGSGSSYHNETGLKLQSPDGTKITLVDTGQYSGSTSIGSVTTRFYDTYSTAPPSGVPTTGYFQPYEALSGFDGETATGTWKLLASDTAGADPLCVKNVSLTVYAEDPVSADAGGPYTVNEGASVNPTLSSAGTTGGTISSVEWDCTNDGTYDVTGTTTTACAYAEDGVYTVKMRATNSVGLEGTDTATVTVVNVAPVIASTNIAGGDEASELSFSASATDAGGDAMTYAWDFGDGSTATGADVVHTYADDGDYTVTVTVDDGDGGSVTHEQTVTIDNVDPVIDTMTIPGAVEGVAVQLSASGSDVGDDDVAYTWTVDGQTLTGASPSVVLADDGSYAVSLTITDGDGGSATSTGTLVVSNANPAIVSFDDVSGDEASSLMLEADVSDVADDTLSYEWDLGDGQVMTTTEPELDYTWADDGEYVVTLTVTDEDGGLSVQTTTATIDNVAPTVDSYTFVATVDEGDEAQLDVTVSDVSTEDTVSVAWDFGDEGTAAGTSVAHTWMDDGEYTVEVTVTDEDGGSYTRSETVTVDNVAPVFSNTPALTAFEDEAWSFLPTVAEPGDDELTFSSIDMPEGAELDEETGEVTWTPSYDDAVAGTAAFSIEVDDGDGGTDTLSWTLTVSHLDSDGDGLADQWETDNGLDPDDASDATGDDDADGRDNLLEFQLGTDPDVFDGPEAPVLVSPIDDVQVADASPTLQWTNAVHPLDTDVITYDVEVYEDDTLAVLLTDAADVAEVELQSSWWVDVALPENTMPVWRVRAVDPYVDGPWSEAGRFFVNAVDEAPPVPELLFPIEGDIMAMETPELQFGTVVDVDGDAVTYDVELVDALDAAVASMTDMEAEPEAADLSLVVVPEAFVEDGVYFWRAMARDEDGLESGWSEWTRFVFSMEDGAPGTPAWIEPEMDAAVDVVRPDLLVSGVTDPEGSAITYYAELSTVQDFSDVGATAMAFDETSSVADIGLDLDADLQEHVTWHARVRAEDASGIVSPWTSTSFFVRGPNDAPGVPLPLAPTGESLEAGDLWPSLVFSASDDPEGDEVTYDVRLVGEAEVVLAEVSDLAFTGYEGSWDPELAAVVGDYYWQVRAVDEFGAASEWSDPAAVGVYALDEGATEGCGCNSAGGSAGWLWLGGLGLMAVRRRRR